jgi:hypothetical protein
MAALRDFFVYWSDVAPVVNLVLLLFVLLGLLSLSGRLRR